MEKVLDILIVNIIIIGCCLFNYSAFTSWFFDDVALNNVSGKRCQAQQQICYLELGDVLCSKIAVGTALMQDSREDGSLGGDSLEGFIFRLC